MELMSGALWAVIIFAILAIIIIAKTAVVVPQQAAYVVERLGKYAGTLNATPICGSVVPSHAMRALRGAACSGSAGILGSYGGTFHGP